MDTQKREPESIAPENDGQTDHVDHLMQLNEVRPDKRSINEENVTDFSINQATPTLLTDAETAAELSPELNARNRAGRINRREEANINAENENDQQTVVTSRRGLAIAGLIASLMSLFVLPIFLGLVGIVLGFVGLRGGNKTVGLWAIGIGAVSILVAILFTPFVVR